MNATADADIRTIDPGLLAHLQTWQGRTQDEHDTVTAAPVRALAATLDRDDPPPATGAALPPLWHWLYFLPMHRQSLVGTDGHPQRGGFLPPVPLPRRMWAGSRVQWHHAPGVGLVVGDTVRRTSRIGPVTHKAGRSGDLVFVQVIHELHNAAGLALTETQDIVYRAHPQPGDPAPTPTAAETGAPWQRALTPDEAMLFRYSALTFNGHRIHYDHPYATQVEGYPGLVVHGPLMATLLLDLVRRHAPQAHVRQFQFKAVRPVFAGRVLHLNGRLADDGRTVTLWANDHEGWLTMLASAALDQATDR